MVTTAPRGGEDSDACAHGGDMSSRASMALSAAVHHSFDKVAAGETHYGLRAQKTDRAEVAHNDPRRQMQRAARGPELFQLFEEEPSGVRPGSIPDPRPQERVQRHIVKHIVDVLTYVQILDVLVPQMEEQLVDIFRLVDTQTPVEQVIDVPSKGPHLLQIRKSSPMVRREKRKTNGAEATPQFGHRDSGQTGS